MNEQNNATCSICGSPYHLCVSCKDEMIAAPWKIHTDTSEHYKIYQILHGFSTGVYDKDEAKLRLQNVDLSDMNGFRDCIKSTIKKIMKEDRKIAVKTKIMTSRIEDESCVDDYSERDENTESIGSV